jgi:hypothetical protein
MFVSLIIFLLLIIVSSQTAESDLPDYDEELTVRLMKHFAGMPPLIGDFGLFVTDCEIRN